MKERVIDITHQLWDLQMKRIIAMSDEEIMADAIREFGSPAAVEQYVERMRKAIANTMWGIRDKRDLGGRTDGEPTIGQKLR